MVFFEDEKPKTWEIQKQEFITLNEKIDLLELERQRYVESQINLIEQKIERIKDYFLKNYPSEETEFMDRKLEELERIAKLHSTKPELFHLYVNDTVAAQNQIRESINNYVPITRLQEVMQRVTAIEGFFGKITAGRIRGLLTNMLETIEGMQKRIQNIEETNKKVEGQLFLKRVEELKVIVEKEDDLKVV